MKDISSPGLRSFTEKIQSHWIPALEAFIYDIPGLNTSEEMKDYMTFGQLGDLVLNEPHTFHALYIFANGNRHRIDQGVANSIFQLLILFGKKGQVRFVVTQLEKQGKDQSAKKQQWIQVISDLMKASRLTRKCDNLP